MDYVCKTIVLDMSRWRRLAESLDESDWNVIFDECIAKDLDADNLIAAVSSFFDPAVTPTSSAALLQSDERDRHSGGGGSQSTR